MTRSEDPSDDHDGGTDRPDWWSATADEFRAHDLGRYRPAKFRDGRPVHEVVARVEDEHGVAVRLVKLDPTTDDAWTVEVDGDAAGTVTARRRRGGYTEFAVDAERFEQLVTEQV